MLPWHRLVRKDVPDPRVPTIAELSLRRLKGKVVEVTKGATTALVKIDVGGTGVTASITNQAVDELGLKVGEQAYAVIKASDVMVGKD